MRFDQDQSDRPVALTKRTTKVNVTVVIGVVLFLLAGFATVWVLSERSPQHVEEEVQGGDTLPGR